MAGRILDLTTPVVMGIINATPDSFHGDSRVTDPAAAVERARTMLDEGAAILDVGAMSSRPGATPIPEHEEKDRLAPVVEALRTAFPDCLISVDTWRSGVARYMVEAFGINMVNDISAGQLDPQMFPAISGLEVPYLMMHMKGTPENMQDEPAYGHVTDEVLRFFSERVYRLKKLGVADILIDPGFGFGKTTAHNYQLLRELDAFAMLELPLVVGISRKSMICRALDIPPENALNGTTAAHMVALLNGAKILRAHDVREAVQCVKIYEQLARN